MWIKVDVLPEKRPILYLPAALLNNSRQSFYVVIFGGRWTWTEVEPFNTEYNKENSYYNPLQVKMSNTLQEKLLLPETLTYQLKVYGTHIVIGPVIGLLLGNHNHSYHPEHMEKYSDRLGIYDRLGGLVCAFSSSCIDWKQNCVYGLFFNKSTENWQYGNFPLPTVVYRRNFHLGTDSVNKLIACTEGRVLNSHRFTKFELYEMLNKDPELSRFLPPTELIKDPAQIKNFLRKHHKIILKPTDLSRGRGICIIEKRCCHYKITDYREKEPAEFTIKDSAALGEFFNKNPVFLTNYLVQKYLKLAKVNSANYDIRVVMQKTNKANWQCTGIECRVANPKLMLTNISRGGYALPLREALRLSFPAETNYEHLEAQIHELCLRICSFLENTGEHYAEFGLDVAVDQNKKLWLIEANVFPSFKGFKKMDYHTYLDIRYAPLRYALSLTDFADDNLSDKEK